MITTGQVTTYDTVAQALQRAADILDAANVAGLSPDDWAGFHEAVTGLREMRARFFHAAYSRFLHERGL